MARSRALHPKPLGSAARRARIRSDHLLLCAPRRRSLCTTHSRRTNEVAGWRHTACGLHRASLTSHRAAPCAVRLVLLRYLDALAGSPYRTVLLTRTDHVYACDHPRPSPAAGEVLVQEGQGEVRELERVGARTHVHSHAHAASTHARAMHTVTRARMRICMRQHAHVMCMSMRHGACACAQLHYSSTPQHPCAVQRAHSARGCARQEAHGRGAVSDRHLAFDWSERRRALAVLPWLVHAHPDSVFAPEIVLGLYFAAVGLRVRKMPRVAFTVRVLSPGRTDATRWNAGVCVAEERSSRAQPASRERNSASGGVSARRRGRLFAMPPWLARQVCGGARAGHRHVRRAERPVHLRPER